MKDDIIVSAQELSKSYRHIKRDKSLFGFLKRMCLPSYTYKEALKAFSLTLKRGEIVGLLGPNGAGKSTFVKIICGLIEPTRGHVTVLECNPSNSTQFKRNIGVVFGQKSSLWWDLSLQDNIKIFSAIYNKKSYVDKQWIGQLIERLDLQHVLNTPIRNLSLGERVKSELISVLFYQPSLLALDEPTIGLDVTSKKEIRTLLKELAREKGVAIFLTSHDMVDIESCCQRVVVIDKGEKIFEGSIAHLKKQVDPIKTVLVRFPISTRENNFDFKEIVQKKLNHLQQEYSMKISISRPLLELFGDTYACNEIAEEAIIQIDLEEKHSKYILGALLDIGNDLDIEIKHQSLESIIVQLFRKNFEGENYAK